MPEYSVPDIGKSGPRIVYQKGTCVGIFVSFYIKLAKIRPTEMDDCLSTNPPFLISSLRSQLNVISVCVTPQSSIPLNNRSSSLLPPFYSQQHQRAFIGYEPKFLGCILHALIISVASILGIGKDVVVANLGNNENNCHRKIKREYCPTRAFGDQQYLSLSN